MQELINIQSELNAPKSKYNSFGKYNYRSTEDILGALKPLLAREECFLTISDDIVLIGDRFYVKSTATITKGEKTVSASAFAREPEDKKGMDSSQITGSTSSYARKYALNGLFAIDDTVDADGHEPPKKEENKAENTELKKIIEKMKKSESLGGLQELYNLGKAYAMDNAEKAWLNEVAGQCKNNFI